MTKNKSAPYNDIDILGKYRFSRMVTFADLRLRGYGSIPRSAGVYVVLYQGRGKPIFLPTGSGGHFRGRDPNVPVEALADQWNEGTNIIYVGAGDDLRERIELYSRFGQGEPVAHWGGRQIWQITQSEKLLVVWSAAKAPLALEKSLIEEFERQFKRLPFANLKH